MYLLIGLGNPGKEYENTRHNIGFMVVDEIIRHYGFFSPKMKFHGLLADGKIADEKVIILKPQTFMNRSGISVAEAVKFYKIPPENIIVLYDELDLIPAKVRVKTGGGSGGHNGIKDIDSHIGKGYKRVRIGIGHPGDKDMVSGYVLHKFSKDEKPAMDEVICSIAEYMPELIKGDDDLFMTRVAK